MQGMWLNEWTKMTEFRIMMDDDRLTVTEIERTIRDAPEVFKSVMTLYGKQYDVTTAGDVVIVDYPHFTFNFDYEPWEIKK